MTLLPVHIIAGLIGIAAGLVALYAGKGATLHRKSGVAFVHSMLVMSVTGCALAAIKAKPGTAMGGVLTAYLVMTGLFTVRRRGAGVQRIDIVAMLVALALGVAEITFGLQALYSISGRKFGYPPGMYFVFGTVALLAAAGDVRVMTGGVQGARRLARHLWRMCFALSIAASFFLGQAKAIPKPIRITPLLAMPVLLVLASMLYWLVRVRFARTKYSPPAVVAHAPGDRTAPQLIVAGAQLSTPRPT